MRLAISSSNAHGTGAIRLPGSPVGVL